MLEAGQIEPGDANGDREVRAMPALPSTGDRPEEERAPMWLVIDLDLDLLPNDPAKEVRRILGFWTAWLPKMDLTRPTAGREEHEWADG